METPLVRIESIKINLLSLKNNTCMEENPQSQKSVKLLEQGAVSVVHGVVVCRVHILSHGLSAVEHMEIQRILIIVKSFSILMPLFSVRICKRKNPSYWTSIIVVL